MMNAPGLSLLTIGLVMARDAGVKDRGGVDAAIAS